jgi:hypothetical protein
MVFARCARFRACLLQLPAEHFAIANCVASLALPSTIAEMSGWLEALEDLRPGTGWQEVSRAALIAWLAAYGLFLLYAATTKSSFLFVDSVNLIIHEAGHFFFGWFGYAIGILGGTLMELIVPLALAVSFWWRRHTTGVAFCLFWFFENFLYIGTYMADARRLNLPLVGDGTHDWEVLFSLWGMLQQDQQVGSWTRGLGWLGMVATMAWLGWMGRRSRA